MTITKLYQHKINDFKQRSRQQNDKYGDKTVEENPESFIKFNETKLILVVFMVGIAASIGVSVLRDQILKQIYNETLLFLKCVTEHFKNLNSFWIKVSRVKTLVDKCKHTV